MLGDAALPLAWLYGAAIRARNAWYDHIPTASHAAGIPVISVGNLTTGGTGKTPLVIEIVRILSDAGRKPAILTRGYAAARGQTPDEVLEFQESLPGVPVIVNPDRLAGAVAAHAQGSGCVVLDDGFQHRRLRRNMDIVVIDALNPWGGGRLIPSGHLREPVSSLQRATAVILSRANQVDRGVLDAIRERILRYAPGISTFDAQVESIGFVDRSGVEQELRDLRDRVMMPVCGIGNPRTFELALREIVRQVAPTALFRDHHRYAASDVRDILAAAARARAQAVVTTRKDWGKLAPLWPADAAIPLLRLNIRARIREEAAFKALLLGG